MPCGGPKTFSRTTSIVQIIFSFRSFEISESILRNQKIIIGLDSFSNQNLIYFAPFVSNERWKITVILFAQCLWHNVAKPRYGSSPFSLICSMLFNDFSFIFIDYFGTFEVIK